jgi:predicted oxidoreductase
VKTYTISHTDLVVSRIGYGCAQLYSVERLLPAMERGDWQVLAKAMRAFRAEPVSSAALDKAARLIHTAHTQGITLFDHADIYGLGHCEAVFGEVLKKSPGLRNQMVIQSKCGVRSQDDPHDGDPLRFDFSRQHIVSSVEGSLTRLGTDRLDILLLHIPDALVEPDEVAQAFDELHAGGKVRYFGVCNHTAAQIERLKKSLRQPLVINQLHVALEYPHLIADGMESNREASGRITEGYTGVAGTLDYCLLNDIQVQAFSPLRASDHHPPKLLNPVANATPEVRHAAQVLAGIAKSKDSTPSAVALAWLLRHPGRILPIIGATNLEHIKENCAADGTSLSREEWYSLFTAAAGLPRLGLIGRRTENEPSPNSI